MIEIKNLQKVVGQRAVLDIEALSVNAGEIAAAIGPAGSGKTTLLSLLIGQSRPTAGKVLVAGLDPIHQREQLSQRMGVVFAENAFYERLNTQANLEFHCRLRGLPASRINEVLAQVGLADHASTPANHLPDGLARRLAFGCAILHRPVVLLLVEPFANCDTASTNLLTDLIRQLSEDGAAVLIFAAEGASLTGLCQSIYELADGRLSRATLPEAEKQAELPFKIPVRLEDKVALLNPADILYASTEDEKTYLYTAEGPLPSHLTLAELEQRLARSGFFRAHRGYLVNLQRVKAIIPYTRDSFTLTLDDPAKTQIPLSKAAARELRELLGY